MKCYQPDYPRPQFVREEASWVNLNGEWDFSFDDNGEGIAKKWFGAFPPARKINVPFSYESPASGIGDPARHDVVWYRRTLEIDAQRKQGRKVFLHFEGSDYNTKVWVNGAYAGCHDGGYARFSFDITPLLKAGNNTLTVRAQDSFDICQPRGKQRWRRENFGCWYVQTTGIWKTVWLEYVNPEFIKSVKMTPVLAKGILEIDAEIESCGKDLELEAEISFMDMPITKVTVPVNDRRPGFSANIFSTAVQVWRLSAWSPSNPNLYDISFSLKRKGKTVDQVLSYFGMREIRIDGQNILLNGIPLYQRLILDQGYWKNSHLTPPDEQALIDDIDKVMAAGYNGVRKHQKIEDEKFLYWADVKGLLVWSEAAATFEFTDDAVTNFTREWMEIVRQNYNHPSIITWTPFNESWGVCAIKT
ncbi:MAG: beta galactosidase jelly roll domain-containing protein, partial [Treponema sp.]|nr:beta galactosidase jelly roll domain-containing protein [Treponema sp.]